MSKFTIFIFIIAFKIVAQPVPSEYFTIYQYDSLYYLSTDKALFKFYSHEESGQFYLTNYIEKNMIGAGTPFTVNDNHLFFSINDSVFIYSNEGAYDLTFETVFVPGYDITSLHGFGPYFFIRSGDVYSLFKMNNGKVVTIEDSLFTHPSQMLVFFTYPYVTIANTVYKYVEGFGFYATGLISIGNGNTGITGNTLIDYYYWVEYYNEEHSILGKTIIEEPNFQHFTYDGWGMNIIQLHHDFGWGTLIAKKNLYYMTWTNTITTFDSQLAYFTNESDKAVITDYYIFLLGGDTLKYSKWNNGSTFFPFYWTDLTSIQVSQEVILNYSLEQNYPNPFNPSTKIKYTIPSVTLRQAQSDILVSLKVFDVLGNEVAILVNEFKPAGDYNIDFTAASLPSGVYFYQLKAGEFIQTRKMLLLK